jgi:Ni,Fe-hydrogenase I small subunit
VATLLWLESGSCSGESMGILGAEGPGKDDHNLMDFLEGEDVELLWHPSLSAETPRQAAAIIQRILDGEQPLTLFCVEGSIIHGPNGTGRYDTFHGEPKKDLIAALCGKADYVFAMGTCAAYGGIPAAPPNPSEASGLQYTFDHAGGLLPPEWVSRAGMPVINVAGCPADAATMLKTLSWVLDGIPLELKRHGKPPMVHPCLADPNSAHKRCRTGEQVGYSCYGCISAHFPSGKGLFRPVDTARPLAPAPAPPKDSAGG